MEEQNLNVKIIPPKDYLPKLAAVAAALLSLFLLVLIIDGAVMIGNKIKESRYIGQGAQYQNTINVAGEGKVLGKPDIGQIDLSVVTPSKTVEQGQKENTEKMNKITQTMKELGIKENDLKTIGYNIYPRYQYLVGKSEIIGYETSQTLRVKIRQLEKVGQILGQAASLGANQIGSLSFIFDEPEKLKTEARQVAVANAKQKADDLAKSLGVKLGKLASFSESVFGEPMPLYAKEGYGIGGGGNGAPQIEAGQNEIIINVNLTYEIY